MEWKGIIPSNGDEKRNGNKSGMGRNWNTILIAIFRALVFVHASYFVALIRLISVCFFRWKYSFLMLRFSICLLQCDGIHYSHECRCLSQNRNDFVVFANSVRKETETAGEMRIGIKIRVAMGPFLLSYSVFVFSFSYFFVSVLCARLSVPSRELLSARNIVS